MENCCRGPQSSPGKDGWGLSKRLPSGVPGPFLRNLPQRGAAGQQHYFQPGVQARGSAFKQTSLTPLGSQKSRPRPVEGPGPWAVEGSKTVRQSPGDPWAIWWLYLISAVGQEGIPGYQQGSGIR